jgi:hypothetical protein
MNTLPDGPPELTQQQDAMELTPPILGGLFVFFFLPPPPRAVFASSHALLNYHVFDAVNGSSNIQVLPDPSDDEEEPMVQNSGAVGHLHAAGSEEAQNPQ